MTNQTFSLAAAMSLLTEGNVAIIPTDTIYGIVGKALDQTIVERIYTIKKRTPTKPFIILISSIDDVELFDVTLDDDTRRILEQYWPGPVSIILPCNNDHFEYLHRGTNSLAFRLPAKEGLKILIENTGPLVAPSANPEGLDPAKDIEQAIEYFGESIDMYVSGEINDKPSRIIRIIDGDEEVIRA